MRRTIKAFLLRSAYAEKEELSNHLLRKVFTPLEKESLNEHLEDSRERERVQLMQKNLGYRRGKKRPVGFVEGVRKGIFPRA